jgi:hypothetical protein
MNDSLETLLKRHDPAAGKVLTSFDRTRMLQAASERRGATLAMKMRIAVAMALLLMITGALVLRSHRRIEAPRQVQYATPGGTRIVWTLNPNFKM